VRFISHHDSMRMFERALARTGLPVRFSEGFNPRPKLSLPLPRPVGMASMADVLVIELSEPVAVEEIVKILADQLPQGVTLLEAWELGSTRPPQPMSASYALEVPRDRVAGVQERLDQVLAAEQWPIHRDEPNSPRKTLDLREQLVAASISIEDAGVGRLLWTLQVVPSGSIRPTELLMTLGLEPAEFQHRIVRTAIEWPPGAVKG